MKLIKLHQVLNPEMQPYLISELWLNKDIIRWAHQSEIVSKNSKAKFIYTKLLLIADDKILNILETPEEINKLCNFIQGVQIVGGKSQ